MTIATAPSPVFHSGQYEYLLVANPDENVVNKVMTEKQFFYDHYKEAAATKAKPAITVASFTATDAVEPTVIRWIERICSKQRSFNVMLNNFSGFPPHSIYVRVQNPQPFHQLAQQLHVISDYIKSNTGNAPKCTSRPHLTIARSLPEHVYSKAMMEYSHRDFHSSFMVQELVLIKRKYPADAGEKVMVFRFLPAEVDVLYATA